MSGKNQTIEEQSDELAILDDLIRRCYLKLLHTISENAKLGEFLNMIELRRKIAPADREQKQFWEMLEEIRQQELRGKAESVSPAPTAAPTSKKQVSA
jgi:hypothetical protein